ncbi:glycosyltransferase family 4 protein [Aureimonas sp. SK2]|uniref:glycosyltransferase family 4 protein n=1 Tax=Aureimonas sp. SK2 TaxID=3015992 RepID=UPI002444C0F6|nr:glycosyltransferase family 4 protein [Aureimonas sp. SK2]
MRIAGITALFPPSIIGGAEASAASLKAILAARGHEVHVLSTTVDAGERHVVRETYAGTVAVQRHPMPRGYTAFDFAAHNPLAKALWHLQDHADPRNRRVWAAFLDEVRPDVAMVHVTQGLGFNGLLELASRDIPTLFVLHDLSLACYKTSMFKADGACAGQCAPCRLSSRVKQGYLGAIPRLGIVSPSRATYETLKRFVPIGERPHRIILNANAYPPPPAEKSRAPELRLLYAGQISRTKGVGFLLETVAELAATLPVSLRVVGGGPELEPLRARYGAAPWVSFTGKVSPSEVSGFMNESDLLCAPSLWAENSPGVVIQAITAGLPVLSSDRGGLPELVETDRTGLVLPAGDHAAWRAAIRALAADRERLARLSLATRAASARFDPEAAADAYLAFAAFVANQPPVA